MSPTHLLYAQMLPYGCYTSHGWIRMKMVRIFFYRICDRIRLEGFKSVHIWVRIFDIWYCIRIRILKLHIYDVDIQSYPIRHSWYYLYSNPNPDWNIKINVISVISIRILSVFIPTWIIYIFIINQIHHTNCNLSMSLCPNFNFSIATKPQFKEYNVIILYNFILSRNFLYVVSF
jgi:hypothetical protein